MFEKNNYFRQNLNYKDFQLKYREMNIPFGILFQIQQ